MRLNSLVSKSSSQIWPERNGLQFLFLGSLTITEAYLYSTDDQVVEVIRTLQFGI